MLKKLLLVFIIFISLKSILNASSAMSVYYDATSTQLPSYRLYYSTIGWSAENKVTNVGGNANGSYVLRTCPRRNENILAIQDSTGKLTAQIWNGGSWGTVQTFSIDVTTSCRAFDVAYEQTSGNAIIAYRKNTYINKIYYSVWNGVSWSEGTDSGLALDGDAINWVRLEANPNSNEMVLATMCISSHVYAGVWSGSAWGNQQALETTGVKYAMKQGFDVVYTSSHNYAMVVWDQEGDRKLHYRQWFSTASAWGSEGTIPTSVIDSGNTESYVWVKLAANPVAISSQIIVGCYDDGYDFGAALWNGSGWGNSTSMSYNVNTSISYEYRCFDVSYEMATGRGMIAYAKKNNSPKYKILTGTTWGAEASAQNVKAQPRFVSLNKDKDSSSNEITLITDDVANDINIQTWTGSAWNPTTKMEVEQSSYYNKECYTISYSYPGSQYDRVPPANISNLTALSGTNDGDVILNWTSPGDDFTTGNISGGEYYLKYSTNSINNNTDFTNVNPVYNLNNSTDTVPNLTYGLTVSGLYPGTTYYFALKYKDDVGNWSSWSTGTINTQSFCAAQDLQPTAPTNLTSIAGDTEIQLSWTAVTVTGYQDLNNYKIYRSTWSGGTLDVYSSTPSAYTVFTDTGLTNGNTYYYKITAVDSGNLGGGLVSQTKESNFSNSISTTIPYLGAVPLPPISFSGIATSTQSINWTWKDGSTNELGFEIYSSTNGVIVSSASLIANTTSYMQTGLTVNTSSFINSIFSINDFGRSSSSSTIPAIIYTSANKPTGVTISSVTANSVKLVWLSNQNPDGTRYGVSYSTVSNFTATVSTFVSYASNLTLSTATATNLLSSTSYWFRVFAYNGNGVESGYTNTVSTFTKIEAPTWSENTGAASTTEMYWEWNDNSTNESGYRVINSTSGENVSGDQPADTNSFSETDLLPNTSYARYVQVFNAQETVDSVSPKTTIYYTLANDPTGITSEIFRTSATISWSAGTGGATCYGIQRSNGSDSAGDWTFIKDFSNNWTSTNYSDTSLVFNTTYWYKVCAYNGDGIESGYIELSVRRITPPANISNLTALSGTNDGEITLNWTSPGDDLMTDNITSGEYYLKYSTNSIKNNTDFANVYPVYNLNNSTDTVPNLTYGLAVTGLNPGTTYYFALKYKDDGGNWSSWSTGTINTQSFCAAQDLPPSAPANLTSIAGNTEIQLQWTGVTVTGTQDLEYYRIYRSTWIGGTLNLYSSTPTAYTVFTDTGLTNNNTYYYKITAIDRGNSGFGLVSQAKESGFSTTVSTIPYAGSVPLPPSNFTANAISTHSVMFTWTDNSSNELGFELQDINSNVIVSSVSIPAGTTFYLETTLTPNTSSYIYNIKSVNINGKSASSSLSTITYTLPNTPASFTASSAGLNSISLAWNVNNNSSITRYGLAYSTASSFNINVSTFVNYASNLTDNTTSAFSLSTNTTYYFHLWAYNGNSVVSNSVETSSKTSMENTPPPANISNLTTLSGTNDGEITLNWTSPGNDLMVGNITGGEYYLKYSTNSINNNTDFTNVYPVYNLNNSTNTVPNLTYGLTVTGLYPGTTYYFALKYKDDVGNWSSWSTGTINTQSFCVAQDLPPSAPANLTSIAGDSAIQLQWTAVTVTGSQDLEYYRIYRSTWNGGTLDLYSSTPTAYTIFSDTGLTNGETYMYKITAIDRGDFGSGLVSLAKESGFSTTISTVPYAGAVPLPPNNFTANAISTSSVVFSWTDNSSNELGFELQNVNNNVIVSSESISAGTTFYLQTTLTANTSSYIYNVKSVNAFGTSSGSNLTTPIYSLAKTPASFTASSSNSNSVTFTWSANDNSSITRYGLSYSTASSFNINVSTFINYASNLTDNTTTAFSLSDDTTYYFHLWAYNGNAVVTSSVETSSKTSTEVTPPANISNLTALSGTNDGEIILNWTSPGDDLMVGNITGGEYNLKYSTNSIKNNTDFTNVYPVYNINNSTNTVPNLVYGMKITGLYPGTTYYFALKYKDDVGNWSSWSTGTINTQSFCAAQDLPPSAPANLTSIAGSTEIQLSWTAVTVTGTQDLEYYRIYRSTWVGGTLDLYCSTPTAYTIFTDTGLTNGETYMYKITAIDRGDSGSGWVSQAKESGFSTTVSTMPSSNTVPLPPTNFTATAISTYSVMFSWNDNSSNESGFVLVDINNNVIVSSESIPAGTTFYIQNILAANTSSYVYSVQAVNASGGSPAGISSSLSTPVYSLANTPASTTTSSANSDSITITWNAGNNSEDTRYGISYSTDPAFNINVSTIVTFASNLTNNTTTVFSLSADTTYYFHVWAYNNDASETSYITLTTKTTILSVNANPTWSSFTVAISTAEITWVWNETSTNEDGYRVMNSATDLSISGNLAVNTTSYTEINLSPNTAYSRYIQGYNTFGTADSVSPKTTTYYTLPNAPTGLTAPVIGISSITITWSAGTGGAACYGIQRSTDILSASNWQSIKIFSDSLTATSYTNNDLYSNTTYWYRIYAYNNTGSSSSYTQAFATTLTDILPPSITHVPVTEVNIIGNVIVISANIVDDKNISYVKLNYRKAGETAFASSNFVTAVSSSIFSGYALIPVSSVTTAGIEYFISTADGINISSTSLYSTTVTRLCQKIADSNLVVESLDGNPNDGSTKVQLSESLDKIISIEQKDSSLESSYGIEEISAKNNSHPVATYSFGPSNTLLTSPIYLTLLYFDLNTDGIVETEYAQTTDINETELAVYFWDGVKWKFIGGRPDTTLNTYTVKTNKFGKYALFAKGTESNKVVPDEKFVSPYTPATFGEKAQEVNIYDASGVEIIKLTKEDFFGGVITWNGTDGNNNYIESGIYIFKVKTTDGKTKHGTIVLAK